MRDLPVLSTEELEHVVSLTDPEDRVSWRDEDPVPWIGYDTEARRVRYFVEIYSDKRSQSLELAPEAYRDVIATLQLSVRNRLVDLDGKTDLAIAIDRLTEPAD